MAIKLNLDNFLSFEVFSGSEKDYRNTKANEKAQNCSLEAGKEKNK